jgi:hypothetical protein
MDGRRYVAILSAAAVALTGATALAAAGQARDASARFACPKDTSREPVGRIYGNNRGSTFCNDGASASATVGGRKLVFKGGVCFRDSTGLNVNIGTVFPGKRRRSDPKGFSLLDLKPGGFVKDTVNFGTRTVDWGAPVKLKLKRGGRSGTFSGTEPKLVNGELAYVKASGSFSCKRVLRVPA